jgi:hypothetical protein
MGVGPPAVGVSAVVPIANDAAGDGAAEPNVDAHKGRRLCAQSRHAGTCRGPVADPLPSATASHRERERERRPCPCCVCAVGLPEGFRLLFDQPRGAAPGRQKELRPAVQRPALPAVALAHVLTCSVELIRATGVPESRARRRPERMRSDHRHFHVAEALRLCLWRRPASGVPVRW